MYASALQTMVTNNFSVLGVLRGSILALPIELLIRQKMIRIPVVGVHVVLGKCDE